MNPRACDGSSRSKTFIAALSETLCRGIPIHELQAVAETIQRSSQTHRLKHGLEWNLFTANPHP